MYAVQKLRNLLLMLVWRRSMHIDDAISKLCIGTIIRQSHDHCAEYLLHEAFKSYQALTMQLVLQSLQDDKHVSEVINKALKGSNKHFVATSGGGVLGETPGPVDVSYPPLC